MPEFGTILAWIGIVLVGLCGLFYAAYPVMVWWVKRKIEAEKGARDHA